MLHLGPRTDNAGNKTSVTSNYLVSAAPPGGYKDEIATIQSDLRSLRANLHTTKGRYWLDRTADALGWALDARCWNQAGNLLASQEGLACLTRIRIAIGRLVWAERTDLLPASEPYVIRLAGVIRDIAHARFEAARAVLVTNPLTPWLADFVLWKAAYDLAHGDASHDRVHAANSYVSAWKRLLNEPAQLI